MEKRVVFALVLSLVILIGYQFIITKMYPPKPIDISIKTAVKTETPTAVQKETPAQEIPPVFTNEKEIAFRNNMYNITFSNVGGVIKNVVLNKNSKYGLNIAYDIFNSKDPTNSLGVLVLDKANPGLDSVQYEAKTFENGVIFTHNFNNGLMVEKKFTLYNSLYRIDLDVTFKNVQPINITKKYSLISGTHVPSPAEEEKFLEISSSTNGKVLKYKKRAKPFTIENTGAPAWLMLKNRYFSVVSRSLTVSDGYFVEQKKSGVIISGLNIPEFIIPSNSSVVHTFVMYAGPSDVNLVKEANIGLEGALSGGFFGGISQILISALKFFHKITRNWGVAILVLTLFINIILLPLTKKSYKSMQEIQILQPKIEKIRQEFKNNPQKLQKEIMELYKKYKVNPMGGCLPMLLQMPIFIALYQGLMNSIDLRGAKFLWIRDLSVPENIGIPITLPLIGNSINILPLLMVIATFFQQRLSNKLTSISQTDEQRQQQKMMSIMMTIMFGFIFYNFPSGLVLYWLGNTVIMTLYQFIFTRKPKQLESYA